MAIPGLCNITPSTPNLVRAGTLLKATKIYLGYISYLIGLPLKFFTGQCEAPSGLSPCAGIETQDPLKY